MLCEAISVKRSIVSAFFDALHIIFYSALPLLCADTHNKGAKTGLYMVSDSQVKLDEKIKQGKSKKHDNHDGINEHKKQSKYLVNARNKNKGHDLRVRDEANCIDASYFKGIQSNQDRTGVLHTHLPKALLTPSRVSKRQNGRRVKEDNEAMFTLTAQDIHGILQNSRIRKLTPRECFRLQGVSEEYFDRIAVHAKTSISGKHPNGKPMSDSQLYKQAGNAVTVSVVRAVAERIAEIEARLS